MRDVQGWRGISRGAYSYPARSNGTQERKVPYRLAWMVCHGTRTVAADEAAGFLLVTLSPLALALQFVAVFKRDKVRINGQSPLSTQK